MTCSSVGRSSFVETVPPSRLDPRDGTAIGNSAMASSSNIATLALPAACTSARNCISLIDLPSASSLSAQRVGERQIHIVAAEQDVLADADAVQVRCALILRYGDQAEVGRPAADIADQDDVAGANLSTPLLPGLRSPCVERRQRFL